MNAANYNWTEPINRASDKPGEIQWDIFALFWLLATLRIEAYRDFPDSLSRHLGEYVLRNRS